MRNNYFKLFITNGMVLQICQKVPWIKIYITLLHTGILDMLLVATSTPSTIRGTRPCRRLTERPSITGSVAVRYQQIFLSDSSSRTRSTRRLRSRIPAAIAHTGEWAALIASTLSCCMPVIRQREHVRIEKEPNRIDLDM